MADPGNRLRRALGDELPLSWVDQLDDRHQAFLADAVEATITREDRRVDEDTAAALSHLPRLLRPGVKKLLGL